MWLFTIFLTEFSPNPVAPQTEWVEMYNDSSETTDLTGFYIRDSTEINNTSHRQPLSGIIPPQNYFTFSFDESLINKTSVDMIRLFNKNNVLIDSQSSKFVSSGLSFSRQTDGSWCPTDISPNLPNNLCKDNYSLQNSPTPIPYISLKIINLDADKELIEITNPNNFSVSLFDWRVRDNSGSIRKLTCQSIDANSSCLSTFSSGYLNNDTDKLTLLDPLRREISIYSYENQKAVKSPLSKGDSGGLKTPTKIILPALPASTKFLNEGGSRDTITASKSTSSVTINQSTPIHNYLSIILMLIGSVFILFPLIFNAKFNKK